MKKYYAVRKGRVTGILPTWDDCKRSVTGYSGAEYKSFTALAEAEAFLNVTKPAALDLSELDADTAVAYVDGSYNIRTKVFGFGAVIFHNGAAHTKSQGFNEPEMAAMRNVAGEVYGSMYAMKYCAENGIKNLQIFYDYAGIEKWCTGEWKTNKEGTAAYRAYYESVKGAVNISFIKVKGHSGDKYNDMADALAKEAVGIG